MKLWQPPTLVWSFLPFCMVALVNLLLSGYWVTVWWGFYMFLFATNLCPNFCSHLCVAQPCISVEVIAYCKHHWNLWWWSLSCWCSTCLLWLKNNEKSSLRINCLLHMVLSTWIIMYNGPVIPIWGHLWYWMQKGTASQDSCAQYSFANDSPCGLNWPTYLLGV